MSDLFDYFAAINKEDFDYVNQMTDDEVKKISPFVILMWMSGAKSNQIEHVILTDTYCNPFVFSLGKHPRLLLKLLIAANSGLGNDRYAFEKTTTKNDLGLLKQIAQHYQCGLHEAKQYKELLSKEDIKELKDILG